MVPPWINPLGGSHNFIYFTWSESQKRDSDHVIIRLLLRGFQQVIVTFLIKLNLKKQQHTNNLDKNYYILPNSPQKNANYVFWLIYLFILCGRTMSPIGPEFNLKYLPSVIYFYTMGHANIFWFPEWATGHIGYISGVEVFLLSKLTK